MKNILNKVFGIEKLTEKRNEANRLRNEAKERADEAKKIAEEAKLTPKELATKNEQPWVDVLETHIDTKNLRNGFFELDWNEYFVLQLIKEGYGSEGDPEEAVVDRWFRTLCTDVANEDGVDMTDRTAGYINVNKLGNGKSEVS
jgi:hypothetical protein